jgi:hypothetical protein
MQHVFFQKLIQSLKIHFNDLVAVKSYFSVQ